MIMIMDVIFVGFFVVYCVGIVYCDVKFENVFFVEDGCIKIGDFGLV